MINNIRKSNNLFFQTVKLSQYNIYGFSKSNNESKSVQKQTFFEKYFGVQSYTSQNTETRWNKAIAPFLIHLCVGGPYAWSVIASTITKENGVVASSSLDWTLQEVTFPFSLVFIFSGLSSASVGSLQIKYGMKISMLVSSAIYSSGILLGALGIYLHSLPLLYIGGGVLTGIGVGTSYTPPIQALMEWFPDRKGLAGGLCIAGFGFGSMCLTPLLQFLMGKFQRIPQYLGQEGSVETFSEAGRLFAQVAGQKKEVVLATINDLSQLPGGIGSTLQEGLYVVGTGNTGASYAYGLVGLGYVGLLMTSVLCLKKPPQGFMPKGYVTNTAKSLVSQNNVKHTQVMKTPQFWGLWAFLVSIASGGMGVIALAKTMMVDQFSVLLPTIVTTSFATSYVLVLSGGNIVGRLFFTSLQDKYGSKFVFNLFSGLSVPLYASIPMFINQLVVNPQNTLPLYGFIGSTTILISIFGGIYAAIPAYEAEIFGQKYIGPIHGKMLLGSTAAALIGPNMFVLLRKHEEKKYFNELLQKVDPVKFQETFHASIDQAQQLVQAKVLTINKLMSIMPKGTIDPSPFLYNSSMYTLSFVVGFAGIIHYCIKPIDPKHYEVIEQAEILVETAKQNIENEEIKQNQQQQQKEQEEQEEQEQQQNKQIKDQNNINKNEK